MGKGFDSQKTKQNKYYCKTYREFLEKVLLTTRNNKDIRKSLYPLLATNLDKLNDKLAQQLAGWLNPNRAGAEQRAADILNFSNLIGDFPLGSRADNIEIAIAGFQVSVTFFTRQAYPKEWGWIQNYLGDAYGNRIKGDRSQNVEKAIDYYKAALEVNTRKAAPKEWGWLQNYLGDAYCERILSDKAQNLEQAIAYYNAALEVHTRDAYPYEWAITQNNLGLAYSERIMGEKAQNIEMAIAAYKAALEVYTRKDYPEDWATTQNSLGVAYRDRIMEDKAQNVEKAIAAFKAALKVYTRSAYPDDWATIQSNLGDAYSNRIQGDKAQNVEKAIDYYKAALKILTSEENPYDWARTQNNLGFAYCDRGQVFEAIAAIFDALQVHTREALPEDWALSQNNLGKAYSKVGQITEAIACFRSALEIRTPEAFPINCFETGRNLGNTAFAAGMWSEAIEGYKQAIAAVEISRSWENSDFRQPEIQSEAIEVYHKIVEASVNNGEPDKAIEYVERSKARRLVELLANRELYPKGDISPEVQEQLRRLKQEIPAKQVLLENAEKPGTGGTLGDSDLQRDLIFARATADYVKKLRGELNELHQQLESAIGQIREIDPGYELTQTIKHISFEEIRELVDDQTAIIAWYITGDRFLTIVITRHAEKPKVWQSSPDRLKELEQWRDEYLNGYNANRRKQDLNWQNNLDSSLLRLSEILNLDEILSHVPPSCAQLILVPHRYLHLFPLSGLLATDFVTDVADGLTVNGESELTVNPTDKLSATSALNTPASLIDLYPGGVSCVPSCQLLQLIAKVQEKTDNPSAPSGTKSAANLFVIENPTVDLTFTEVEVAAISRYFDSAKVLSQHEATKVAFLTPSVSQLQAVNYLHFSCYAYFNFEAPELSAIILADASVAAAPANDKSRYLELREGGVAELDKCLTVADIFALNLPQYQLVTLSACETGLTNWRNLTDEYISFASGFLVAGCLSIVCSLWAVSDLTRALFMIKFYQNLQPSSRDAQNPPLFRGGQKMNGVSVAKALQNAQLWLRDVTKQDLLKWLQLNLDENWTSQIISHPRLEIFDLHDRPFEEPCHWAAFCAIGL